MEIFIKGIKYKVELLTKEKYLKKFSNDSYAITDKGKKILFFRKDKIDKKYVIHEVMHSYINECHLNSCHDLSNDDFEEIICELVEDHYYNIGKTANEIYKYLKDNL